MRAATRLLSSRPALRWLVPVAVVAVIGGIGVAASAIGATAGGGRPPRSAAQLLTDLQGARLDAASGTVTERSDFFPALPAGIGGDGSSQFDSLITGSHTLRVWYDGPQRDRVALIGTLGESDVIHNGRDLWIWSSTTNTYSHVTVPNGASPMPHGIASSLPNDLPTAMTPAEIADDVIAALTPTTSLTTGPTTVVAGRAAYQLIIAPKDPASLVGHVAIAIDATEHVPLRIQIFAVDDAKPTFEISYSQITFATPARTVFGFNPPPGASIREIKPPTGAASRAPVAPAPSARVIGSGWTAVVVGSMPFMDDGPGGQGDSAIDAITKDLPTIHGPWGTGQLLETKLFSALLTSDGRISIRDVEDDRLIAAISK